MTECTLELQERFERAAALAGATRATGTAFAELVALYREPHRKYHTLAHVGACLVWLDWFYASAEHPEEVELALFYHDAIYALEGAGNERRSAALARRHLGELGIEAAGVERIATHVEATEEHAATCGDSALVVAVDLAVLGARPLEFDLFERRIREEYAHVPEQIYRAARRRVLERFLERPAIYRTAAVAEVLEARARENLRRRIAELAEGGPVTLAAGQEALRRRMSV